MAYNYHHLVEEIDRVFSCNPRASLSELSVSLKVDRHTIVTAVKYVRGIGFARYRQERLLDRALSLLTQDTIQTVKEVSFSLHFGSPQAFSRFVRMKTGLPPSLIMRERLRRS